jgi:hypothetical protein
VEFHSSLRFLTRAHIGVFEVRPFLALDVSLPSHYNSCSSVAFLRTQEENMRYWKFLGLATLIAALLSIPNSAPRSGVTVGRRTE